jgi:hypothetical protein
MDPDPPERPGDAQGGRPDGPKRARTAAVDDPEEYDDLPLAAAAPAPAPSSPVALLPVVAAEPKYPSFVTRALEDLMRLCQGWLTSGIQRFQHGFIREVLVRTQAELKLQSREAATEMVLMKARLKVEVELCDELLAYWNRALGTRKLLKVRMARGLATNEEYERACKLAAMANRQQSKMSQSCDYAANSIERLRNKPLEHGTHIPVEVIESVFAVLMTQEELWRLAKTQYHLVCKNWYNAMQSMLLRRRFDKKAITAMSKEEMDSRAAQQLRVALRNSRRFLMVGWAPGHAERARLKELMDYVKHAPVCGEPKWNRVEVELPTDDGGFKRRKIRVIEHNEALYRIPMARIAHDVSENLWQLTLALPMSCDWDQYESTIGCDTFVAACPQFGITKTSRDLLFRKINHPDAFERKGGYIVGPEEVLPGRLEGAPMVTVSTNGFKILRIEIDRTLAAKGEVLAVVQPVYASNTEIQFVTVETAGGIFPDNFVDLPNARHIFALAAFEGTAFVLTAQEDQRLYMVQVKPPRPREAVDIESKHIKLGLGDDVILQRKGWKIYPGRWHGTLVVDILTPRCLFRWFPAEGFRTAVKLFEPTGKKEVLQKLVWGPYGLLYVMTSNGLVAIELTNNGKEVRQTHKVAQFGLTDIAELDGVVYLCRMQSGHANPTVYRL